MKPSPIDIGLIALLSLHGLLNAPARAAGPLVLNGDFEQADPADATKPLAWERPDGLGVVWTNATGSDRSHGRFMAMNTAISERDMDAQWARKGITDWNIPNPDPGPVAATYGLSYYSDAFPVASGQAYRVSFDFKAPGAGAGAKVWVRGYCDRDGKEVRRYEAIVNCRVKSGDWTPLAQTFYFTRVRPEVTRMKVMLYAYWPPGVYRFDNVRVEPIPLAEYEKERSDSEASRPKRPVRTGGELGARPARPPVQP